MKRLLGSSTGALFLVCFILFFGAGLAVGRLTTQTVPSSPNKVLRESGYPYINPVLLCNKNDQQTNLDESLKNAVSAYVSSAPEKGVSVYYLDLNNTRWTGVNENETFSPASMLKVPRMVAILKYAESHSDILAKEIYYDGSFDDNRSEYFKPQQSIKPHRSYTVDQLITYMIVDSDNNALRLLNDIIDERSLQTIYINLGIQIPVEAGSDFMSPKTYSFFLRLLYNSTYLDREMSEKALHLLTAQDFPQGLEAGLPSSVEAAQKFGERQVLNGDGTVQELELHDCGIVYAPNKPYLLCIMTRGMDFPTLQSEIRDISKIVYTHVIRQ